MDLRVDPGERVLLLGPSGSGKSTLLAGLAGLIDPGDAGETEGTITLDGVPARKRRARAGLVLQDPESALVMGRAGDDVAFGLENRGVPTAQIWARVDEAMTSVGFPYGREQPTAALSGGEQQRLALAGIVALRPGLLLLDEVTANLDPEGRRLVHQVLAQLLAARGTTAVLVEHRVDDVLDLVDRAVVLAPGGGVIADGPPTQVFGRHGEQLAAAGVWVPGHHPLVRRRAAGDPSVPRIVAEQVAYVYPGSAVEAVSPTDIVLTAGRARAVTGPNGSGKSTLALVLAGLLRQSKGRVSTPGLPAPDPDIPLSKWPARHLVRYIGSVFQNPEHQFVAANVKAELTIGPLRAGASEHDAEHRAEELMQRLGLHLLAQANPFTLSGGEKRRLSVATAIATSPQVLVADEPTFGQDARTWAELAHLLADLRDDGCALLLVTHDRGLVEAIADDEVQITRSIG